MLMAHLVFFFVSCVRFSMKVYPKLEDCLILSTCSSGESRDVCVSIYLSTDFSTFDMHQLGKIRRLCWKEQLKICKLAKFESDTTC